MYEYICTFRLELLRKGGGGGGIFVKKGGWREGDLFSSLSFFFPFFTYVLLLLSLRSIKPTNQTLS